MGSNNTRLNVWQASFDMIRDHPLTGIGLDQFLYKYQIEYVKPEAWLERFTSHPHNFLLDYIQISLIEINPPQHAITLHLTLALLH